MPKDRPIKHVLLFSLRFLLFVVVLVAGWWLLLPAYAYLLVQVSGGLLRYLLGMEIRAGYVAAEGLLNTETRLVFHTASLERALPVGLLVTNLPPYVALVLATKGLALARRLRILLYGCGILVAGHVLFIVVLMRFQEALKTASEVPTAVMQFYLTLPFLLWIVFAYWDRLTGATPEIAPEAEENGTMPEDGND